MSGDKSEVDCWCGVSVLCSCFCFFSVFFFLLSAVDMVCERIVSPLEREQHKRAKASVETMPIQSMPVPKRTPVKAVPGCRRNRTPPAPGGNPPHERQTWPLSTVAPPLELEEDGLQRWQVGVDANPP